MNRESERLAVEKHTGRRFTFVNGAADLDDSAARAETAHSPAKSRQSSGAIVDELDVTSGARRASGRCRVGGEFTGVLSDFAQTRATYLRRLCRGRQWRGGESDEQGETQAGVKSNPAE